MLTASNVVIKIPDGKAVKVFLPMKNNHERHCIHGVYQNTTSPFFSLNFDPGVLPINSINSNGSCILNINIDGPTTYFEAKIHKTKDFQNLIMTSLKQIRPEQMREFFRVKVAVDIIAESLQPQRAGNNAANNVILAGETIDISASGILACFPNRPVFEKQVKLKIILPTPNDEIISLIAHPVRTIKISDNQYDVAFHFDDITGLDRDKMIEFCLVIQRKLLRLKIKVKDL